MDDRQNESESLAQERLNRVFKFLRALHEMRNPVQSEIDEQRWTLWFRDLPDHPAVKRGSVLSPEEAGDQETEDSGFVLKVRRPELTLAPQPPAEILEWLKPGWDSPERDSVEIRSPLNDAENGVSETVSFDDDPRRVQLLAAWLKDRQNWLVRERPARKAMAVFEKLFALQSLLERESERFELMLGDGLLVWDRSDRRVHHPVLLQRLRLEFNPSIPEFQLYETEHPPELYTALFRSMSEVSAQTINKLRDDLDQNGWHPLGGDDTDHFLKLVAHGLSPTDGVFKGEGEPDGRSGGPEIGRAPVIFLRAKTLGFSIAIESILQDLSTRTDFPESLTSIVGIPPRSWTSSGESQLLGHIDPNGEDESILLSKEANAEQLEIARRLERYGAVLVQGPPGTGKTHTIANLLGHLLAQGKSVLVTAHTSKALRVLRDKVVAPLQPLCVSVLDGTRDQLESSIDEISSRLSGSDEDELERQAQALAERRKDILHRLREAREQLLVARQSEYRSIVVAGTEFSPSEASRFVASSAAENAWIPAPVAPGAPLPLSAGELAELYHTNAILTQEDQEELAIGLPDPDSLLLPLEFEKACAERQALQQEQLEFRTDLWETPQFQNPADLNDLLAKLARAVNELKEGERWRLAAIAAGRDGGPRREAWVELLAEIEAVHALASEVHPILMKAAPSIPETCLPGRLLQTLSDIRQHLAGSARLGTLQLLLHPQWKVIVNEGRVNGKPPGLLEDFQALEALVKLREARARLCERWSRQVSALDGAPPESLGDEPEESCRLRVPAIRRALEWWSNVWTPLERELRECGLRWDALIDEVEPESVQFADLLRLRTVVTQHLPAIMGAQIARLKLAEVERRLSNLAQHLELSGGRTATASTVRQLSEAVLALNPEGYREAFRRLTELKAREKYIRRRNEMLAQLEAAAPGWAAAIRNRTGVHGGAVLPGDPEKAWTWRQLNDELDRRAAISLEELQRRCERLRDELMQVTSELIEKKTWAAQIRRTTLEQRQALNGWKVLMYKVGKGTGKRAPRLRSEARRLMPICQSAVPVWIMPLSQVVENFDPRANRFDVVIIDEASQADVMALAVLYMGRQVVIVGDPEQVTPDAVGQGTGEVQQLIDTYLTGIPNAQMYDGQTSIYQLAQTSFSGTVVLREHFRCVPDIIQFSNSLSYHGKIQPLRDPSTCLLRPHTVAYRVNGVCNDRNINEVEARTVAALLVAATEQPEYLHSTFGVISLLGAEQAAVIDLLLQRFLPPAEYVRRRVQCGNPAQFQGDERDVIFLSMVHSPTGDGPLHRIPDPGERIKKRFNVAASRARDQMWVVHSVDPDVDLQPDDIRRSLILHARDPQAQARILEQLETRTESEFEREVLRRLVAKGYKVTPQWRVGPYRIDLVVEDGTRRLAVECDGDRYHPLEKLSEDMARQAVLERLGWRFARIRGSSFFRNPDAVMNRLYERLETMGINPAADEGAYVQPDSSGEELKERVIRRAHELLSQWTQLGEDLTLTASQGKARGLLGHTRGASGSSTVPTVKSQTAQDTKTQETVEQPSTKAAQYTKGTRGKSAAESKIAPSEDSHTIRVVNDEKRPGDLSSKNMIIQPHAASPTTSSARNADQTSAGRFDIVRYLKSHNLEVIDKRPAGGALWVIGGWEVGALLRGLRDKGYKFIFAKDGSKSTNHRPAWFIKRDD